MSDHSLRDGRKIWVSGDGGVDDLTTHPATRAMVDLITNVQTVRSCLTAGELDPQVTQAGYVFPVRAASPC
jgi:aromatic ring hydroxylase